MSVRGELHVVFVETTLRLKLEKLRVVLGYGGGVRESKKGVEVY
jgi:hypothetical protein